MEVDQTISRPDTPFSALMLKSSKKLRTRGCPPTIKEPLRAREVKQGQSLTLQCLVVADPEVEYQWTKNNIPINLSTNIKYGKSTDNSLFLTIEKCRVEDSGVYMVIAKNSYGMAKISCQVLVTSIERRLSRDLHSHKAVFVNTPTDQIVKIGGTLQLIFELRIFIDTKIIWLLNGQQLKATTRIQTDFDGRIARLIIKNFKNEDIGLYTLTAISGDEESSFDVFVQSDQSNVLKETFQQTKVAKRKLDSNAHFLDRSLKPVQGKLIRIEPFAPIFIKPISSVTTMVNRSVQFSAQVKGYPKPELSLFFNKTIVNPTKMIMIFSDERVQITLNNIQKTDFGLYTLNAKNEYGEISCSARLQETLEDEKVSISSIKCLPQLSTASIPADPSMTIAGIDNRSFVDLKAFQGLESHQRQTTKDVIDDVDTEPPRFLILPERCIVAEGEILNIWAKIYSETIPQIIWLKDNGEIALSSRIELNYDNISGRADLIIKSARIQDSGTYALIVRNKKGSITAHAYVQIQSTLNIDERAIISSDKFDQLDSQHQTLVTVEPGVSETSCVPDITQLIRNEKANHNILQGLSSIPQSKLCFINGLNDQIATEGESIYLQAKLSAFPIPQCNWYYNNNEIQSDSHKIIGFNPFNQLAILQIPHVTLSDQGEYKICAKNSNGQIESIAMLVVNGCSQIDESSNRQTDIYQNLERQIIQKEYSAGVDEKSFSKNLDSIKSVDDRKIERSAVFEEPEAQPPCILQKLNDCTVDENQKVVFKAQIDACPKPQITWFHNSQVLTASNRIHFDYNFNTKEAMLSISFVKSLDAGLYEVIASNSAGKAHDKAMLNVNLTASITNDQIVSSNAYIELDKAPIVSYDVQAGVDNNFFVEPTKFSQFEQKPESAIVFDDDESSYSQPTFISPLQGELTNNEGNVVQIVAVVSGYPLPEFEWKKDNELIQPSNRIQCDYNMSSKLCCLVIGFSRVSDSGQYTLTAKNKMGQNSSSTKLIILPVEGIDTNAMISPDVFERVENRKVETKEIVPGVDQTSMFNQDLFNRLEKDHSTHVVKVHELEKAVPRLLTSLVDVETLENEDVHLSCQVFGLPIPEPHWYKDDFSLEATSRHVIFYDILNKTAYLWIKKCRLSDCGSYSLVATNSVGSVTSQCTLLVKGSGKDVDDSSFVSPEQFQQFDVERPDQYAELLPGVDNTGFVDPLKLQNLEMPIRHEIQEIKEIITELKFEGKMDNVEVLENQTVLLQSTISGSPVEKIEWFVNEKLLDASSNVIAYYDQFTHQLSLKILKVVYPIHCGHYKVIVSNRISSACNECDVNVKPTLTIDNKTERQIEKYQKLDVQIIPKDFGPSEIDRRPYTHCLDKLMALDTRKITEVTPEIVEYRKPVFVGPVICSKSDLNEMDNITLAVKVDGLPIPKFYWMKDGMPLYYSNRFAMNYDIINKSLHLYIQKIINSDSGVYQAIAENSAGFATSNNFIINISKSPNIDNSAKKSPELFANLETKASREPVKAGIDSSTFFKGDLLNLLNMDVYSRPDLNIVPGVDQSTLKDYELFKMLDLPRLQHVISYDDKQVESEPRFLNHLTATDVIQGQSALISIIVEGWPLPEITWYKNDNLISSSNRISFGYDIYSKIASLLINQTNLKDNGIYTIKCSNKLGSIKSSTKLTVSDDIKIDYSPFLPNSQHLFNELDEDKLIKANYDSGVDLTAFTDFNTIDRLEKSRILPSKEYSSGIDSSSNVDSKRFEGLERTIKSTDFTDDKSSYRAPMILQPLSDVSVVENEPIRLQSIIDGHPLPNFELLKDGQHISSSNRLWSFYDLNSKILFIEIGSCRLSDQGTYSINTFNECGSSQTSANVTISKTQSIDKTGFVSMDKLLKLDDGFKKKPLLEVSELPTASPKFQDGLLKAETLEGNHFTTQIQLTQGWPLPSFTWTKDDKELSEANRFLHHYDMLNKTLLFKVMHTNRSDTGTYKVVASNKGGSAEFKLNLTIIKSDSIDQSWQHDKSLQAITELDKKLSKPLITTIISSSVDEKSFVDDIEKFKKLEIQKPRSPVVVSSRKQDLLPLFEKQLENQTFDETQDVILTAKLNDAFPMCSIQWFRNRMELRQSNRLTTLYDVANGIISLQLNRCTLADSGQYTVTASNKLGKASSTCNLLINSIDSIDISTKLKPERLAEIERPIEITGELDKSQTSTEAIVHPDALKKIDNIERLMLERSQPNIELIEEDFFDVKILQQPEPKLVFKEGDVVCITCMVIGSPLPQFIWYKDNVPLSQANRYISNYDIRTKTISLIIKQANFKLDQGAYKIEFIDSKKNKLVSNQCDLSIKPTPSIEQNLQIQSDHGIRTLDEYSRQLEERRSKAYAKLDPGVDYRSFVDIDKFNQLEQQEKVLVPIVAGVDSSSFVPVERFSQLEREIVRRTFEAGIDPSAMITEQALEQLKSLDQYKMIQTHEPLTRDSRLVLVYEISQKELNALEGYPISVYCTIDAFPIPEITLSRNGQAIRTSQRIVYKFDPFTGIVSVHFMNAYLNDSGQYELCIVNSVGQLKQTFSLNVEQGQAIDETSYVVMSNSYRIEQSSGQMNFVGDRSNLDFSLFPQSTVVAKLHQDVRIEYKAVGGANANISWLLNNVEITAKLKIEMDENGLCNFILKDLTLEQCGIYTCVVQNSFGEFSRHFAIQLDDFIDEYPIIKKDIQSSVVRDGEDLTLDIEFTSSTKCECVWTLNDMPLKQSDRISFQQTNNSTSLKILKMTKVDGGWYQCVLRNQHGTSLSTKVKIIVIAVNEVASQPFSPLNLRSVNKAEDIHAKWIRPNLDQEQLEPSKLFFGQLRRGRAVKGNVPVEVKLTSDDKYSSTDQKSAQIKIHLPEQMEFVEDHDYSLQTTIVPIDDPNMKVEWYKDDKIIESGERYQIEYEMGYTSVTIKKAQQSDAGLYKCVATNKYGKDSTTCLFCCQYKRPIHIYSGIGEDGLRKIEALEASQSFSKSYLPVEMEDKPQELKVTMELNDVEVKEKQAIKLIAKFSNTQAKKRITWTLNGKHILNVGRYFTKDDGSISTLTIDPCRTIDNGIVSCTAKNRYGEATTSCNVKVNPLDPLPYTDLVISSAIEINLSADEIALMEKEFREKIKNDPLIQQAKSEAIGIVKKFVDELKNKYKELAKIRSSQLASQQTIEQPAPIFLKDLRNQSLANEIKEGQRLVLCARFQPNNCSVIWSRNHGVLQNSKDIQIRTDNQKGQTCLVIPYALKNDSGLFSVKISNSLGFSSSQQNIIIKPQDSADQSIIIVPEVVKVKLNSEAIITCRCRQTIQWLRLDEKQMPSKKRIIKLDDQNTTQLVIPNVKPEDAGKYGCKVIDQSSKIVPFEIVVDDDDDDKKVEVVEPLKEKIEVNDEHCFVELKCQMQLQHKNEKCIWTKNGQPLNEPIADIESIGQLHILRLYDLNPSDQGVYKATMQSSKINSQCELVVKNLSNQLKSLVALAPKSISVLNNQSVKFEIKLNQFSSNNTRLEWSKGDLILSQSQDYEIWYKEGHGVLYIKNVTVEDNGIYSVNIYEGNTNILKCNAMLNVRKAM